MLPEIPTPRLLLRPASPAAPTAEADLDALWALWTDPEVRRFLFDDAVIERERAAELIGEFAAHAPDGLGLWILEEREPAADAPGCVGCVALLPAGAVAQFEPRLAGEIEVVIALAPALWHRGYAAEALAAAIGYGFGERGLPQIAAAADLPNEASHTLITRLGFEPIGECAGPRHRLRSYLLRPEVFTARQRTGHRAAAGGGAAFDAVWREHRDELHRLSLTWLSGDEDAEVEALARVRLAAASRWSAGTIDDPRDWLQALLRDVCMDLHREHKVNAGVPAGERA